MTPQLYSLRIGVQCWLQVRVSLHVLLLGCCTWSTRTVFFGYKGGKIYWLHSTVARMKGGNGAVLPLSAAPVGRGADGVDAMA
jgi:hypothetical protein